MLLKLAFLATVSLFAFSEAKAAVITTTTVDLVSSSFTNRPGSDVVNGAGFISGMPGAFSVDPTGTMWLNAGASDSNPTITFDLGGLYNLSSARIWNYNENLGTPSVELARGVKTLSVQTSTDDSIFTTIANITLNEAPGVNTVDFSQVVDLVSGPVEFIRFANLVSFAGTGQFTGLSQVQFSGNAVVADTSVPEPFSAPLLAVGLAATWLLRRREII